MKLEFNGNLKTQVKIELNVDLKIELNCSNWITSWIVHENEFQIQSNLKTKSWINVVF